METPQEVVNKKMPVKDLRAEIKEMKNKLFLNTAVMKADKLREYLDKLRYATNLIEAENALGHNEKIHLKDEHKHMEHKMMDHEMHEKDMDDKKMHHKKMEHKMEQPEKKIKKEIETIKKEMKREEHLTPKEVKKEHHAEMKHLDEIPKALHAMYRKHLKTHGGDHMKAKRELKKEMKF